MNEITKDTDRSTAEDPLVGVPSHPVAAVAGAVAAGAATGAVVGTVAGPIGTAIGAAVGAVVGAMGGDAIASSVQEASDNAAWRDTWQARPYVTAGDTFEDFGPAFGYGSTGRERHAGRSFDEAEPELALEWPGARGTSRLDWDRARHAAREAWNEKA